MVLYIFCNGFLIGLGPSPLCGWEWVCASVEGWWVGGWGVGWGVGLGGWVGAWLVGWAFACPMPQLLNLRLLRTPRVVNPKPSTLVAD